VETGRLIENIASQNYNTRDLVFLKKYSQIAAAPMLKGSVDFGVRIYPTDLIDPITMGLNDASKLRINKFQNAIDSVMKIRTLTKQDSLKFQIKAFKSSVKNTNINNSKIDTVKIYKTPSLKK
jgi:hypothetical protein